MSQLISCYQSIQSLLTRISLKGVSPMLLQQQQKFMCLDQFNKIKQKISDNVKKTNLLYIITDSNQQKGLIEVNGIFDSQFYLDLSIMVKVRFFFNTHQIAIYFTVLRNSIPFRIINKSHRLTINKLLLRINSNLRFGSFRLDPITGQFSLCSNIILTQLQFFNLIWLKKNQISSTARPQFLQTEFLKGKICLRTYFGLILHIINQLPENYPKYPQFQNERTKQLSKKFKQFEITIRKMTPTMHLQFPFMFSEYINYSGKNSLNQKDIQQMINSIKFIKKSSTTFHENITRILHRLVQKQKYTKIQQSFSEKQKVQFAQALMEPTVRSMSGQNLKVYTQIDVLSAPNSWDIVDEGGFGIISKALVKFCYKAKNSGMQEQVQLNNQPIINKIIVKKQDFQAQGKKLNHQKSILGKIKDQTCHYLAKYYQTNHPGLKKSLLMQYCPQRSLSILKSRNGQFLTLATKLMLLKNIAQGIKFLKDQSIYHLDLKPTNVLIAAGLAKIIDFGEAYCHGVCARGYRPGTSIPYSPPESFNPGDIPFGGKMDVFSLGVIMWQLLYDTYPFDYTRHKYQQFKKLYTYKQYPKTIMQAPERVQRQGFSRIHYILKFVALRCLEADQKRRPCIEWIIIVLHLCIGMEGLLYG